MKILYETYKKILNSYPVPPPEQGGILGQKDEIICEYYHDGSCTITDRAFYEIDVDSLNEKLEEWANLDIQFVGVVHSHMVGQDTLSMGDKEYIEKLFEGLPDWISNLYFPIIIPEKNKVISYIAQKNNNGIIIQTDELDIIL